MDTEIIINQEGKYQCSICKNEFDWKLKLAIIKNDELEQTFGKISSQVYSNPDQCVSFKLQEDNQIIVNIFCPKCGYMFETKKMPKMKQKR